MTSDGSFTSEREQFGANVAAERKRTGLTQEQLGWAAGLHQTAVARIEQGKREPRFETVLKLARALEVPPADLFDGIVFDGIE